MVNTNYIGTIILIVLVFVDIVLILITALLKISRNQKLKNYTLTAEATVTSMEQSRHHATRNDRSAMWYPTFTYTINGLNYIAKSNVGTTSKPYEVGDRVKIKVDPNDPQKYILTESKGFNIAFGVLMALTVFFIIATVITAILVK